MANTNKGRKFYVCATAQATDLNKAGFEALTWVEVGHVGSIGQTGTDTNIVSYDELATDVLPKAKGISNAGDPQVEVARDYSDAGQDILRTAAATRLDYAFKMEDNDAPSGSYTNTIYYNRGKISGPVRPNGRNEDFVLEIYTLGLVQTEIVVDPEAASAPSNVLAPAISGSTNAPDVSSGTLYAWEGTWSNQPTSYTYQWQRDTAGDGSFSNISGATSQTYDPVAGDLNNCIRVQVTAVNGAGSTTANSMSSAITVA